MRLRPETTVAMCQDTCNLSKDKWSTQRKVAKNPTDPSSPKRQETALMWTRPVKRGTMTPVTPQSASQLRLKCLNKTQRLLKKFSIITSSTLSRLRLRLKPNYLLSSRSERCRMIPNLRIEGCNWSSRAFRCISTRSNSNLIRLQFSREGQLLVSQKQSLEKSWRTTFRKRRVSQICISVEIW